MKIVFMGTPDFAKTILEAYVKREHLEVQGKNARKFAEENAARKTQTKKYFDILSGLVK